MNLMRTQINRGLSFRKFAFTFSDIFVEYFKWKYFSNIVGRISESILYVL